MASYDAQAAWTREKGKWFIAESFTTYRSHDFIDDDGTRHRQPAFRKQEWNNYAEYGWREGTTLGGNFSLHRLTNDTRRYTPTSPHAELDTEENYGLADSEIFLRQHLWRGSLLGYNVRFALQPLIKFPGFYLDAGSPRSGTDDFDTEIRLQTGIVFSLFNRHHFITSDMAYRKRFGEWRDQFRLDSTLGLNLSDRVLLLTQLFRTERVEGTAHHTTSNAAVNDYDLLKAQISIAYRLTDNTRIQFGGHKDIYARNTGDGEGILLSLWREF